MTQQPVNKDQRPSGPVNLDMFNSNAAMIGEQSETANLNSINSLDFSILPRLAATSSEYQLIKQSLVIKYGYHLSFGHYSFAQKRVADQQVLNQQNTM